MKRLGFLLLPSVVVLGVIGIIFWTAPTIAGLPNSMTNIDYSGQPTSMPAGGVVPDVLFVMDASSSMRFRVATSSWSDSVVQNGVWDTMKCYVWDPVDARFEATATVKTVAVPLVKGTCAATEWDGNFLNWAAYRRIDVAHVMWTGGTCWHPDRLTGGPNRNADLTCRKFGTPLKATITLNDTFQKVTEGRISPAIPGASLVGRMPTTVLRGGLAAPPANIYIQTQGSGIQGAFCVDNDNLPGFGSTACSNKQEPGPYTIDAGPDTGPEEYTEQGPFYTRLAVDYEPTGVLQNTGSNARFGLMEFADTQKGYLTVPMGSRQTRKLGTKTVVTWPSNYEAMIRASDNFFHLGGTPTMEAMYQALRYLMQLPPAFASAGGEYNYGYSPAGALGASTAGAFGAGELSVLSGSETCPAEYLSNACGRDPYVYGSAAPAWAGTTAQVSCCKATVILMTDDDPDGSSGMPAGLNTWFTSVNGSLLPGYSADYHNVVSTAYWMHINDIRGSTFGITGESAHPLPGNQFANVYTFYLFGKASAGQLMLKDAAKWGAFEDSNGNNKPDLVSEWDKEINATGLPGSDGIPDAYFESASAVELGAKLTATLATIISKAGSGTSGSSVLATSAAGEGAIYQAYFFPATFVNIGAATNQVTWTGFTQGLFIDKFGNLREDYSGSGCTGPPDGKLVLTHDCIIKVRLETNPTSPNFNSVVVDRYKDDGTAPGSVAGNGVADTAAPFQTVALSVGGVSNVQPLWEGGRRLALLNPGATCESSATWPKAGNMSQGGKACRRILTWADLNNGGNVDIGETLEFSTANAFPLCPYLGGPLVLDCNSSVVAQKTAAQNEATNIISWIRGSSVSGLRDRTFNVVNDSGATVQAQWKLGDVVNSTPVVVGPPRERFDVVYGDATYAQFFQRYKDRREVAYVGANDGMLHAFNAGFFKADASPLDGTGPTVQVRFTTTPKQLGKSTDCAALPCDASVTTYNFRSDAPLLGAELWAFIPQDLLPQLQWLTSANYDHMYYVDLTPKVTDARIFAADADHPGGWGTILIGGFRLGGSCATCTSGKGTPRVVQADFNNNGTTTDTGNGTSGSDYRVFLSSYFVMDITNPEKEPTLLWTFRDQGLGLTTAAPAVIRVNPLTDAKTSSTNERWYAVFGTGPTHHNAFSTQNANIFAVDLKLGPAYGDINKTSGISVGFTCSTSSPCIASNINVASGAVRVYQTLQTGAFMADAVTLDFDLNFRVDMVYAGSVICNGTTTSSGCGGSGPVWKGAMWRLTTNGGDTNPDAWGTNIGCAGFPRCPSKVISTFAYSTSQATTCANASPCNVGPITAAPALTQDDTSNIWLFFGTGRFSAVGDKGNVDIQHFFGVKDCIITGGCTDQTVEHNNLFNSSNVVTCSSCAAGSNVSTTGSTTSFTTGFSAGGGNLVNNVQNMDGWFTTFNDPTAPLQTPPRTAMTPGERNLSSPTLIGGTVFFTTFIPTTDICLGIGTGQLYAVFYLTGGPYTASAIGTAASGSNTLVSKSISLGQGLPSQMGIQVGAQGSGTSGTASSSGCAGRLTGFIQAGGALGQTCGAAALSFWSRMISWRDL